MNKYISIVLFLSFACGQHSQKDIVDHEKGNIAQEVISLDVGKEIKNEGKYYLSKISDQITYVPLETNKDILLGNIRNVIVDEFIYVLDDDKIYRFTKDGKFLNRIGVKGRGPGEYQCCIFLDVDRNVYFLDVLSKAIREYTPEGLFCKRYDFEEEIEVSIKIKDNLYKVSATPSEFWGAKQPKWVMAVLNTTTNKNSFVYNSGDAIAQSCNISYKYNNELYACQLLSDTLFRVNDLSLEAVYVFEKGEGKSSHTQYYNGIKFSHKYISPKWANETNRALLFRVRFKGEFVDFVYDKNSKILTCLSKNQMINDLDGGFDFYPDYVNNNQMIKVLRSEYIYEEAAKHPESQKIQLLSKSRTYNDNPVLMIVK